MTHHVIGPVHIDANGKGCHCIAPCCLRVGVEVGTMHLLHYECSELPPPHPSEPSARLTVLMGDLPARLAALGHDIPGMTPAVTASAPAPRHVQPDLFEFLGVPT